MTKHLIILTLIFSLSCLINSIVYEMGFFTICGWTTACISTLNLITHQKIDKDGRE
jgi:hypothetical protein